MCVVHFEGPCGCYSIIQFLKASLAKFHRFTWLCCRAGSESRSANCSWWSFDICIISGWWFGTFFIFHNIWDHPSHWLIFFNMVKTTNQVQYLHFRILKISHWKNVPATEALDLAKEIGLAWTEKCRRYTGPGTLEGWRVFYRPQETWIYPLVMSK